MNPALRDIILESGQAAPAFVPTDIADLALWIDAADASTITLDGSGNVEQWNDKSGNGRNLTQATVLNRPAYVANIVNGLPVVRTNGTNSLIETALYPATDWYGASGDQVTIISLFKKVVDSGRFMFALSQNIASGASAQSFLIDRQPPGVGTADMIGKTATDVENLSAAPAIGTALTMESITWQSPAAYTLRRYISGAATDYTSTAALTGVMDANQKFSIGSGAAQAVSADFCEHLIYTRKLLTSEIEQIEAYLLAKWGTI